MAVATAWEPLRQMNAMRRTERRITTIIIIIITADPAPLLR